ncbi:MAG TPA: TIGR03435 family protein, partial [Verrucomicrobiae bacterium]|nr:TIGR03435 family protein [Verrucomicrobiae bacterium]
RLVTHEENRTMDAWAITIAPNGPSFRSINSDAPLSTGPGTHVKTMPPLVGMIRALIQAGNTPVLDQTGLTGTYDICLDLHRLQAGSHDPEDYVALIKDELGLKVALARVPLKMIVIDHLAQPSAN